jgi:uncharacterized protein (TIGR00369 family)
MTESTNPDALLSLMPFAATLGVTLVAASPAEVLGRLAWQPQLCTTSDVLHGGALMAFADTVGAVCAVLNLPPGAMTTTIESKTNFLRAVREGNVESRSTPLHVGRSTIVVDTELRDGRGKLVARVTQTQAVLNAG